MYESIFKKSLPKIEDIKKTILLTHKNCSDGSGCALMFMEAGGLKENIFFANAGQTEQALNDQNLLNDNRFLIIADLGFNDAQKEMESLIKRGNFVLLDHHETNLCLKNLNNCFVSMDACGTELLRQYLLLENEYCKKFASDVDDIDRWIRKNLPNSGDLAEYHCFLGQEIFIEKFSENNDLFQRSILNGWLTLNEKETLSIIKRKKASWNLEALKKVIILPALDSFDREVKFGYVLGKGDNDLADLMLEKFPEIEVACFFDISTKSVSLRSRKNGFNVAKFAKEYGGGGHARSAGHKLSSQLVTDFVEGIH